MTAPAIRPAVAPRPLLIALYAVAAGFILPSLMEFMLVSYPYRPGTAQWRFGAVGLIYNSVLFSPLIGLLLVSFAAVQLGHRRTARTFAVIALTIAALVAIAAPFFVLDFLQLRTMVNPAAKNAMDFTSLKGALTGAIMFCVALAIGLGTWRSTPGAQKAPAGRAPARQPSTVVVGTAEAPRA